ncbi:MAG: universal stress protein [Pseudomonadota bacterium]
MSTHYLAAVDLTHMEDAKALLREAGRWAERDNALLSVMTVLPDYGMSFVGSFFKEGTLKEAEHAALATLHALAEDVLPDRKQVQCIVEVGTAYEEVVEVVDKVKADHIVVGAHKPDLVDRILGPNASRIVRYAPVTVSVLRS